MGILAVDFCTSKDFVSSFGFDNDRVALWHLLAVNLIQVQDQEFIGGLVASKHTS
jgi:hypothetical protein